MSESNRAARLIARELQLLATVDSLLGSLREALVLEERPVAMARIRADIEQQEKHRADALARIDGLRASVPAATGIIPAETPPRAELHPTLADQVSGYRVFVSYAHEDEQLKASFPSWTSRLLRQLTPAMSEGLISVWVDQQIGPGRHWHAEISKNLMSAQAAVLMIDAAFLSSTYIREHELPPLLARHHEGSVTLLPVVTEPCDVREAEYAFPDPRRGPQHVRLGSLQCLPSPDRTLSTLSAHEASAELVNVVTILRNLANGVRLP